MISVLIIYPISENSTFDMDYYTNSHMPMFADALGEGCQDWGVMEPSEKYHAIAWAIIDSQETFDTTMANHGARILADIPNYTSAEPEVVVGPVVS